MPDTVLFSPISQFGAVQTTAKTPLIELASMFPLSLLRDIVTTTGSGAATTGGGEHRLATTASGTDSVTLDSAERGRYKPGYSAEYGSGIRIPVLPTGNQVIEWGYFDSSNGVYFGVDANGVYIARLSNSVETKMYQNEWNSDRLDGFGPSEGVLDLSKGNIFQIVFSWYGYGVIEFQLVFTDAQFRQRAVTVHRLRIDGSNSIQNPNLPIRVRIENNGTATPLDVYVGGRQFSIIGLYVPNERNTAVTSGNLTVGTTSTPLISIRRKMNFNYVPLRIGGIDIITTGNAMLEIYLNATLTTPSYGAVSKIPATETALEADFASTSLTGGTLLYATLVGASGSGGNRSGEGGTNRISVDIPEDQPVTLALRSFTATVDVTAAVLRMAEQW